MDFKSNGQILYYHKFAAVFLLVLLLSSCSDMTVQNTSQTEIQRYLKIVYPTSIIISEFSAQEAEDFYRSRTFWYRVPSDDKPSGILTDGIKLQLDTFMMPDTVAVNSIVPTKVANNGFTSDTVLEGSNRHYIEITSYGWSPFPYGAYYNWAAGSGLYVYTGGSTLHGFNKIDLLYQLSEKELSVFYAKLTLDNMVISEIIGSKVMWNASAYSLLLEDAEKYLDGVQSPNLIQALISDPILWEKIRAQLPAKNSDAGFQLLLEQYVSDHRSGTYSLVSPRYEYMTKEASASVDKWLYIEGKSQSFNVLQMTKEPNNNGTSSFELMDTRWPLVDNPNAGDDALNNGKQWFSLKYVWQKAIDLGWYQLRDPFNLHAKEIIKIVPAMPLASTDLCKEKSACLITPSSVSPDWLPENGWNVESCKALGGCTESITIKKWKKLTPCPSPLIVRENECHLVNFGINAQGNGIFSITDIDSNRRLMGQ